MDDPNNYVTLIFNQLFVCICLAKIQTNQSDKQILIIYPIDYLLVACLKAINIPPLYERGIFRRIIVSV